MLVTGGRPNRIGVPYTHFVLALKHLSQPSELLFMSERTQRSLWLWHLLHARRMNRLDDGEFDDSGLYPCLTEP